MNGAELVLAAALLIAPPGSAEPPMSAEDWPTFQTAIHKLAIEWELLDPRETRYVMGRFEDYSTDLNLLRRRYQDLAGAPRLYDSFRLPDRRIAAEMLTFNRSFRQMLDNRQFVDTDRSMEYRSALRETDQLFQVWDGIRDARCEFYYVFVRRLAMKRIRDAIGPEAWANGGIPPAIPQWRLVEHVSSR